MNRSFFEIAALQRRRSILLLAVLGLIYFVITTCVIYVIRYVFNFVSHGEAGTDEILSESALVALGLGAALVLAQVWFARTHAVEAITGALRAREPDTADRYHRRFGNLVEEMRIASGVRHPVRAVVCPLLAPAAFAAQDTGSGAVIGVTEGLLGLLNRSEVQAVVAHEMTHIREGDASITAFSCALLSPFVAFAEWLGGFAHMRDETGMALMAGGLTAKAVAGLMRLVCTALSREREELADAGAVELTRNPLALASALAKLDRSNTFLGGIAAAYAPIFILDPTHSKVSVGEGALSNLFSSHPPVERRLNAVLLMANASRAILEQHVAAAAGPDSDSGAGNADAMMRTSRVETPTTTADDAQPSRPWLGSSISQECPACRNPMHEADYEGVMVSHCTKCGGYLVPVDNVARIISRREMQMSEELRSHVLQEYAGKAVRSPAELAPQPGSPLLSCPDCRMQMTRQYFNYQLLVVVDRCYGCNLIWFGAKELEAIQILSQ